MKKLYTLALSLASVVAMQAQTITIYDKNNEKVADNATVTITTPDPNETEEDTAGSYWYTFNADLSMQGTENGSITIYGELVEHTIEGISASNVSYQVCPNLSCANFTDGKVENIVENYNASTGKMGLDIHIANNRVSTDKLVLYSKANYTVYYTNKKETTATHFTLVFDYNYKNAAIGDVAVDTDNAPVEYYNLSGVRVNADNLATGLYVRRQGNKSSKIFVR
jgi:hypothetical protein